MELKGLTVKDGHIPRCLQSPEYVGYKRFRYADKHQEVAVGSISIKQTDIVDRIQKNGIIAGTTRFF